MAGTTPPPTPLRLKDLLELDCDSCSAAGFRCYPRRLVGESAAPMRHLLESPSLRRRRRPSKLSHLSRSLSRRLSRRGGFWRRRDDDEDNAAAAATATAASAGCGSSSSEELETSSSSESSDNSNSSGRTSRRSRSESDSDFLSSATEDSVHHPSQAAAAAAAAAGDEHEVAMKRVGSASGSEADDKEQLSPVAVMDFPFDDDEEEEELTRDDAGVACSPSFSLARLQRGKTHKIRRFGIHDELAPLDLEARLATTSDPDVPAAADDVPAQQQQQQMIQCRTGDAATPTCAGSGGHSLGAGGVRDVPDEDEDEDDDLTSLLTGTVSAGLHDASERLLLLDFFVEMKRRRSEAHAEAEAAELALPGGPAAAGVLRRRKAERVVDGDRAVAAARGWLEGTGTQRWGLTDVLTVGAAIVAEMDRGRRWMQVGEEEREVGTVVAGMLADELVSEVVRCLFV